MKSYWYCDDLEVRYGHGGDQTVVSGPIVRYGDTAKLGMFTESIAPGAFSWTDVAATIQHDRHRLIGRSGANLSLVDSPTELRAELRLLETRDSHDAQVMLDEGLLRGWSAEFKVADDSFDGISRTIRKASLRRVSLVDQPAYSESVAEIQHRYEQSFELEERAKQVKAAYKYGQTETVGDQGRNRKRRIKPGAFKVSIDDPEQEITLSIGRNVASHAAIASKMAKTLLFKDTADGLEMTVKNPPDTQAMRDLEAQAAAGMEIKVTPLFRELDGEYVDLPEPGNPGVKIREYSAVKLYGLALAVRQPKGAESSVEVRNKLWDLEIY